MQTPGGAFNQGDAFASQQGFASQPQYGQQQQPQYGQMMQPQYGQFGGQPGFDQQHVGMGMPQQTQPVIGLPMQPMMQMQQPQYGQPQYGQFVGQPGFDQQHVGPVIGLPMQPMMQMQQPVQATVAINNNQPVVMATGGQIITNTYREMPAAMATGGQIKAISYREMPVVMASGGQIITNTYREMPVAMSAGGQIIGNSYREMSKSVYFAAPLMGGRKEGEWPTDFCSCCAENTWAPNLNGGCFFCFQVFLCPCLCYGRNVALLTRKKAQVNNCMCFSMCAGSDFCNCMFWLTCMYFAASACCLHAPIRQQIRELNKMPTGVCDCVWDIISTSCCFPCAIIQDYNLIIRLPDLQSSPAPPPGSRVGVSG